MVVVAGLALVAVSLLSLFRLHQLRGRQLRDSTFLIGLVVAFVFQLVQGVLAMNRPEDSRVVGTIAVLVVICSRVGIGRALVRPPPGTPLRRTPDRSELPPQPRPPLRGDRGVHSFDVGPFSSRLPVSKPSRKASHTTTEVHVMLVRERSGAAAPFSQGVTWGGLSLSARRIATVATSFLVAAGVAGPAMATAAQAATPSDADLVSVVVQETGGTGSGPERAVQAYGGSVTKKFSVISGFSAKVPSDRLDALRAVPGVSSVTEDASLTLSSTDVAAQASQAGSLYTIANQVTGASTMWKAGYTGQGVDVAVVDSGVVPLEGLDRTGKIVYGPDLTQESGTPTQNLDTYGHGTHMAGIIAGRDAAAGTTSGNASDFVGMAPDSRIVSIKVADAKGQTDVSQAIAAIDWVVENGHKNGLNIRVMNMSFGTDGTQSYVYDPLAYAAEMAWRSGIVVVVAAGNDGNSVLKLNNPASDPYVIAVGSDSANGTATTADDTVSSFSNNGNGSRNPDLIAPGDHVVSLRDPGSYLDTTYPDARIGTRLFRGSGTSQAAAVVSGAAALLISQRPALTPDQVKALLTGTASRLPGVGTPAQGNGLVNLAAATTAPTPQNATQRWRLSVGTGSLEAARGSVHVSVNGRRISGEVDVHGRAFNSGAVASGIANHSNWSGVSWSGVSWSGVSWSGVSWSGVSWSGVSWSGVSWSGVSWSGVSWSGVSWSGVSWSGVSWS